jgi:hypothetical protein
MGPADDGERSTVHRQRGEIECPMELMALHPDERDERPLPRRGCESIQIVEVGLHVLVDGLDDAGLSPETARGEAREVRDRAVGHEPAPESLDETVAVVLARLDDDDPERGHGSTLPDGIPLAEFGEESIFGGV